MYVQLGPYSEIVKDYLEIPKPIWDMLSRQPRHAEVVDYNGHKIYIVDSYAIPESLVRQTYDEQPLPDRSKLPINPFFVP